MIVLSFGLIWLWNSNCYWPANTPFLIEHTQSQIPNTPSKIPNTPSRTPNMYNVWLTRVSVIAIGLWRILIWLWNGTLVLACHQTTDNSIRWVGDGEYHPPFTAVTTSKCISEISQHVSFGSYRLYFSCIYLTLKTIFPCFWRIYWVSWGLGIPSTIHCNDYIQMYFPGITKCIG